jgi:hypothetical protein
MAFRDFFRRSATKVSPNSGVNTATRKLSALKKNLKQVKASMNRSRKNIQKERSNLAAILKDKSLSGKNLSIIMGPLTKLTRNADKYNRAVDIIGRHANQTSSLLDKLHRSNVQDYFSRGEEKTTRNARTGTNQTYANSGVGTNTKYANSGVGSNTSYKNSGTGPNTSFTNTGVGSSNSGNGTNNSRPRANTNGSRGNNYSSVNSNIGSNVPQENVGSNSGNGANNRRSRANTNGSMRNNTFVPNTNRFNQPYIEEPEPTPEPEPEPTPEPEPEPAPEPESVPSPEPTTSEASINVNILMNRELLQQAVNDIRSKKVSFWEAFGVPNYDDLSDSTKDRLRKEFKKAFRKASVKFHPDKSPQNAELFAQFSGIRPNTVLGGARKRKTVRKHKQHRSKSHKRR